MSTFVPMPMPADRRWPQALITWALVLAALLWLYRATLLGMVEIWSRSETFTHAFTVVPISLWLVWRRRALLARLSPRPEPWLLGPMALAALAWLLGDMAAVNALMQFALVALVVMSVPALLGWQVARTIRFALLFLFFCVPFGDFLIPKFMDWTADFTVWALQLSGIPVLRDGLQFAIPSGHWSVEVACSGIRYLMASVMVGTLFAYLNYQSMLRRWLFVGVSIVVPIVANWLRAYLIVMVGHLSGNELATGADHLIYGWVFFGVVIMLMLAIGAAWSQPEPVTNPAMPAAAAPSRAGGLGPVLAGAVVLGVLALPHGLLARLEQQVQQAQAHLPDLESVGRPAAGWTAATRPPADWQNGFVNPTLRLQRNYVQGERLVGMQLAYYAAETPQSKLVSSVNALASAQDGAWTVVRRGSHAVEAAGRKMAWRTAELRSQPLASGDYGQGDRLLVWQAYWINGVFTTSDAWAKALMVLDRLGGGRGDGMVVLLYALQAAPGQAVATLESFVRDNGGVLASQLSQARNGGAGQD